MSLLEDLKDLKISSANLELPDPELLAYYKNLEDRTIWINFDIDESLLEVSKKILEWNKEDKDLPIEQRRPIKLLIFSYGGEVNSCFSFIDVVTLSKTPVYTYNMGVSMSAGLLILLSGHKRFCLKHSTALIHSGSGGTSGTFEQTEAQMADYKVMVKNMQDYILERTNIDQKTLNKHKGKEWYIYSQDQVNLGIVNEIISCVDDIL